MPITTQSTTSCSCHFLHFFPLVGIIVHLASHFCYFAVVSENLCNTTVVDFSMCSTNELVTQLMPYRNECPLLSGLFPDHCRIALHYQQPSFQTSSFSLIIETLSSSGSHYSTNPLICPTICSTASVKFLPSVFAYLF